LQNKYENLPKYILALKEKNSSKKINENHIASDIKPAAYPKHSSVDVPLLLKRDFSSKKDLDKLPLKHPPSQLENRASIIL
jgi:hypothetical protein